MRHKGPNVPAAQRFRLGDVPHRAAPAHARKRGAKHARPRPQPQSRFSRAQALVAVASFWVLLGAAIVFLGPGGSHPLEPRHVSLTQHGDAASSTADRSLTKLLHRGRTPATSTTTTAPAVAAAVPTTVPSSTTTTARAATAHTTTTTRHTSRGSGSTRTTTPSTSGAATTPSTIGDGIPSGDLSGATGTTSTTSTPTTTASSPGLAVAAPTPTTTPATTPTAGNKHSSPPPTTTTTTAAPAPTTTTTAAAPAPTGGNFLQGAYAGGDNPNGVASFGSATNSHPVLASDYLPGSTGWAGMDGANGNPVKSWSGSGYTLSLGVPIIPTQNGSPVGTLAAGATGAYNTYYTTLAHTLISAGESNAFLRLGWEFDGNWFAWNATTPANESAFAKYFQQIVTTMRAVPGAQFRFVWNPDASAFDTAGYNESLAWPGASYVDAVGIDAYDQSWASPQTPTNAWNQTTAPTLVAAHNFAAAQGRPLAVCEWGVAIRTDGHGLGDDPLYVTNMINWMKNAPDDVVYESYFDANDGTTNSIITGGSFPNSLSAFRADL